MTRSVTLVLVLACASVVAAAEKPGEPILLFNGRNFDGWVMTDGSPVNDGWEVVDGEIHLKPFDGTRAGSIRTTETFGSFELEFEWRVAAGGNSGVKYRAREADSRFGRNSYGCEYQLLDDKGHKNGRKPLTSAGALYGLYPPDPAEKQLRPVGEFNRSRIIVDGDRVEHWLNGKKIVEAVIGSDDWEARFRKSKVADVADFARQPGSILLQEHLSEAWFRNIRLTPKPLRADEPAACDVEPRFDNQTGPNRRVLSADYSADKKRLALVDAQGKIHWETKINNVHDVHLLDNGNILTQTDWTRVVEFDPEGNVVWDYDAGTKVYSAIRLKNGNTLIGTGSGHSVIEVTPDQRIAWSFKDFDVFGNAMPVAQVLDIEGDIVR